MKEMEAQANTRSLMYKEYKDPQGIQEPLIKEKILPCEAHVEHTRPDPYLSFSTGYSVGSRAFSFGCVRNLASSLYHICYAMIVCIYIYTHT